MLSQNRLAAGHSGSLQHFQPFRPPAVFKGGEQKGWEKWEKTPNVDNMISPLVLMTRNHSESWSDCDGIQWHQLPDASTAWLCAN